MERTKFIEIAAAFSLPFAADFFNLPIFLKDWKDIFKTISSIFASCIYIFIRFSDPNTIPVRLEKWWVFFIVAFVALLIYIFLFLHNSTREQNKVSKASLIFGLFIFCIFYGSLTGGFSFLFQSINHKLLKFKVVDSVTNMPVSDAKIKLFSIDTSDSKLGSSITFTTNKSGKLERYFLKDEIDKIKVFDVTHIAYSDNLIEQKFDIKNLYELQNIKLSNK
jgi:hypothetical protein